MDRPSVFNGSGRRSSCSITHRSIVIVILFAVGVATFGCGDRDKPRRTPGAHVDTAARFIAVLVDRSASARRDTTLYAESLHHILAAAQEGDRVLIAPITATSGTDFGSRIDYALPSPFRKQGIMEEPVQYRREHRTHGEQVLATRNRAEAETRAFLEEGSWSGRTTILESVYVLAPVFQLESRRKVLVILSDMVEESDLGDFRDTDPTAESTRRVIKAARSTGIMPDLSGVSVYVAGAIASPPPRAAALERFWQAYFEAAGATMVRGRYQRVLASFP